MLTAVQPDVIDECQKLILRTVLPSKLGLTPQVLYLDERAIMTTFGIVDDDIVTNLEVLLELLSKVSLYLARERLRSYIVDDIDCDCG